MKLIENFKKVLKVNVLTLIMGLITTFIVPLVIEVGEYSNLKTYMLYISYIGLIHFGFIDGMYIKYGGKNIEQLDKKEFKLEHRIFLIMELSMTIILGGIGYYFNNNIIVLAAFSIIPINLFSFYKFFFQAIGEFGKYSKISYIYIWGEIILTTLIIIIVGKGHYIYYCLPMFIANLCCVCILEIKVRKYLKGIKFTYNKSVWKNISVGGYILLGNLSVIILYGIDKWFIKGFFSDYTFAYYSFAISMLNIITVLVNAISLVFYNYLFSQKNMDNLTNIKDIILVIGGLASGGYFALSIVVENIIPKYLASIEIIGILFLAYPYMLLINILFINLYKYKKMEKKYLLSVVFILGISVILNFLAIVIFKEAKYITIATTITYILWCIKESRTFKVLKIQLKDIIYLSLIFIVFILTKTITDKVIGGSLYIGIIVSINLMLYKNNRELIFNFLKNKLRNTIKS